jgi:hypothetical protein
MLVASSPRTTNAFVSSPGLMLKTVRPPPLVATIACRASWFAWPSPVVLVLS